MSEGDTTIPYFYDVSTGTFQYWKGRDTVKGLITTDVKQCTAAGITLLTVTSGKKGYVKGLFLYNSNGAAQTITIADTDGNKFITYLAATSGTKEIYLDTPFLKLAAGAVTGTASVGDHVNVIVTYFEDD